METGIIMNYDEERGYGFVKDSATGQDYFFHIKDAGDKELVPLKGEKVSFEVKEYIKGFKAIGIKKI